MPEAELKTASFRQQHGDILKIAADISQYLNKDELSEKSNIVSKLMTNLARKIKMHLTIEDASLYPVLLNSDDEEVKKVATEFIDEMGHIKDVFDNYIAQWPTGFKINERPDDFIKETQELFSVLADRIDREDNKLYILVDEI